MTQKQALGPSCRCSEVTLGYAQGVPVVDGLDFSLPPGASLAIVGASGCGKSTLLTALAGIRALDGGRIQWIKDHQSVELDWLTTSFVWQQLGLFPWKRVQENLALPLQLRGRYSRIDQEQKVRAMFKELQLEGLQNRFPSELSGGQRQRLALGRALIVQPDVLFMDEPFSAIDALLREHLQQFLAQMRRSHPCTVVLVTHDIAEAVVLGSHILVLSGKPAKAKVFFANPAFDSQRACALREHPQFYPTVQKIHQALADAPRETR